MSSSRNHHERAWAAIVCVALIASPGCVTTTVLKPVAATTKFACRSVLFVGKTTVKLTYKTCRACVHGIAGLFRHDHPPIPPEGTTEPTLVPAIPDPGVTRTSRMAPPREAFPVEFDR